MKFALALIAGIASAVKLGAEETYLTLWDDGSYDVYEYDEDYYYDDYYTDDYYYDDYNNDDYYYDDWYSEEANALAYDLFDFADADNDWVVYYDELDNALYDEYMEGDMTEGVYEWALDTFDALDENQYGLEGFVYYEETMAAADELLATGEICYFDCDFWEEEEYNYDDCYGDWIWEECSGMYYYSDYCSDDCGWWYWDDYSYTEFWVTCDEFADWTWCHEDW